MARTTSTYPGSLDTFTNALTDFNPGDAIPSSDFERALDAIKTIETELGTDPAGASTDLVTRLAGVTATEFGQIANIGAVTVSATQWGALGALVEWTDWTPTLTGDADLSGYTHARYYRLGDICFWEFSAEAKNVTTSGVIQVTLPFTHANTGHISTAAWLHDGTIQVGSIGGIIEKNVNHISIPKTQAGGAWAGTENGIYIRASGHFEII